MHRLVIAAFAGVQSLDVAGPAEVFAAANGVLDHRGLPGDRYDVRIVAIDVDPVATAGVVGAAANRETRSTRGAQGTASTATIRTESAVRFDVYTVASVAGPIDTLVVPGGFSVWNHRDDARLVGRLGELIARSSRLVTVCSGAALAAATGVLDGHRVTTHWARADRLAEAHPDIHVDPEPIFIRSNADTRLDVWSSAGVTAGIDLSLAIVEDDHSTDVAQEVARWLVMYLRRPGGQSQFASPTWIRQAPVGPIRRAQESVIADPGADHRVGELAQRVAMSERHFVRRFSDEVGVSPARFVAGIRVDAARHELETSHDTVRAIAQRCGFGTAETLRRTLHRHLGVSPEAYRQRFSHRP